MIAKTYILGNLTQLDSAYRRAKTQKHSVYFSKLALLELCGWIEISMDDIVLTHSRRHVLVSANTTFVDKEIVRRNYGFDYTTNFRSMLIKLVGIVTCEKLEAQIPVAVQAKFVSQLGSLKTARNSLAHTYLKGAAATLVIDAPSVTKARFADIYEGLKAFDRALRSI